MSTSWKSDSRTDALDEPPMALRSSGVVTGGQVNNAVPRSVSVNSWRSMWRPLAALTRAISQFVSQEPPAAR